MTQDTDKQARVLASAADLIRQMRGQGLDHFEQIAALTVANTLLALEPYPSNSATLKTATSNSEMQSAIPDIF